MLGHCLGNYAAGTSKIEKSRKVFELATAAGLSFSCGDMTFLREAVPLTYNKVAMITGATGQDGAYLARENELPLLRYYANSIAHLLERNEGRP